MKGYWAAHADRPPPLQRPPPLAVTTAPAASTPTAEEPQSEPGTVAWLRAGAEARLKAPPLGYLEKAWSERERLQ